MSATTGDPSLYGAPPGTPGPPTTIAPLLCYPYVVASALTAAMLRRGPPPGDAYPSGAHLTLFDTSGATGEADPSGVPISESVGTTPLPTSTNSPDLLGIPTGAIDKVGPTDGNGKPFNTNKVSHADSASLAVGVPTGILLAIVHTESILGAVAGGCMGSIVAAAGATPSPATPPLLSAVTAFFHVIVGVPTPAGASTILSSVCANRDDPIELAFVPTIMATTFPIPLTIEGTVSGPTLHRTTKARIGCRCDSNSRAAAAVVSPVSKTTSADQQSVRALRHYEPRPCRRIYDSDNVCYVGGSARGRPLGVDTWG